MACAAQAFGPPGEQHRNPPATLLAGVSRDTLAPLICVKTGHAATIDHVAVGTRPGWCLQVNEGIPLIRWGRISFRESRGDDQHGRCRPDEQPDAFLTRIFSNDLSIDPDGST